MLSRSIVSKSCTHINHIPIIPCVKWEEVGLFSLFKLDGLVMRSGLCRGPPPLADIT